MNRRTIVQQNGIPWSNLNALVVHLKSFWVRLVVVSSVASLLEHIRRGHLHRQEGDMHAHASAIIIGAHTNRHAPPLSSAGNAKAQADMKR